MRHGDVGALTEHDHLCPPCKQGDCGQCLELFRHPRFGLVDCDCDHGQAAS